MTTNRGLVSYFSFRGTCFAFALAASAGLLGAGSAHAVDVVTQTLDSVDVFAPSANLSMEFNKSKAERSTPPFMVSATLNWTAPPTPPPPGTTITSCQRSGTQELYCLLSNDDVYRFTPTGPTRLFSCRDTALGLDTKSRNAACTSITADLPGEIWISGRKNTTHSIIHLVEVPNTNSPTVCADKELVVGTTTYKALTANSTSSTDFCFLEFTFGRPIIIDSMFVDGKNAADFEAPLGSNADGLRGVLFMEDRKTVAFLPATVPSPGYNIASGKTAWGIGPKEDLQGVAWYPRNPDVDLVFVTTSTGRVLARNTDGTGGVTTVFDTVLNRSGAVCPSTIPAQFEIRVSQESKRIYVTDRQCRTVSALQLVTSPMSNLPSDCSSQAATGLAGQSLYLCNAKEPDGSTDVTLATAAYEPLGVAVSPGIAINLRDCETGVCTLVPDGEDTSNNVGAQMSAVKLDPNSASGLAVFQIKNIPDCRYITDTVICPPGTVERPTVVTKNINGKEYKFLDVGLLMPEEVKRIFDPGEVPQMLISPQYRGQALKNYYFDGFFGRSQDGVRFRRNFDFLFDIYELAGGSLGCGQLIDPVTARPNLNWDIVTTVSERYPAASQTMFSAGGGLQNVDMLQNTDCYNPTSGSGTRWSFYGYNMELDPSGLPPANPYRSMLASPPATAPRPDIFADLLYVLYQDLNRALEDTAKVNVDGNDAPPLTTAQYNTLAGSLTNVLDKLNKCVTASYDKQSAAAQNCSSLTSQLDNFANTVLGFPMPSGLNLDKANRIGELRSRALVMKYVTNAQFVPSIPSGGFNNP